MKPDDQPCHQTAIPRVQGGRYFPWLGTDLERTPLRVRLASNRLFDGAESGLQGVATRLKGSCRKDFGFALIAFEDFNRDIPIERLKMGLAALANTIGTLIPQDHRGALVGELTGNGKGENWYVDQPFHTDGGDLLVLLCVRRASCNGGATRLASSAAAYERLSREPGLDAEIYFKDWSFHRGSRPGPAFFKRPIFSRNSDGDIECFFLPGTLRATPAVAGTTLSAEQLYAIEKLEAVLADPDFFWEHHLAEGELLMLSNRAVLHARSAYSDVRRTLLRGWIEVAR